MAENYYETLGVLRDASNDQIKRAYRKIAVKFHPDKNPGNKVAEEMFCEATEAYEILKDPVKRRKFDSKFNWSQPKKRTSRKIDRSGADLRVKLKVHRTELIRGAEKAFVIERKGLCKKCEGTGSMDRIVKNCVYCNGTGLHGFSLALGERKKCKYCKGAAKTPGGIICFDCKGTALAPEIVRKKITLNPFMDSSVVLAGLGNYCFRGQPGSLVIDLEIIENPRYIVHGLNVTGNIRISPAQAVLGDTLNLTVFGKEVTVRIPEGTNNRDQVDVKYGGITYQGKKGDFKTIVYINIPLILSEEEKNLYKKLLQIEKETVWPKTMNF